MATAPGIIDQTVSAGGQFTGVLPNTKPSDADGIRTFGADPVGGLFEFDFAGQDQAFETYVIDKIMVDFGLSGVNSVNIVGPGARVWQLAAPGPGAYLFTGPLELAWDEKIRLNSNASANPMFARVHARPGRPRPAS